MITVFPKKKNFVILKKINFFILIIVCINLINKSVICNEHSTNKYNLNKKERIKENNRENTYTMNLTKETKESKESNREWPFKEIHRDKLRSDYTGDTSLSFSPFTAFVPLLFL